MLRIAQNDIRAILGYPPVPDCFKMGWVPERPKLLLKWYPDINIYFLLDKSTGRFLGSADVSQDGTIIVSESIKNYFKSLK